MGHATTHIFCTIGCVVSYLLIPNLRLLNGIKKRFHEDKHQNQILQFNGEKECQNAEKVTAKYRGTPFST